MVLSNWVRRPLAWTHLWLGLVGGLLFCAVAVSGAIVTFRPQIARVLSPPPVGGPCVAAVDWNQAQRDIEAAAQSTINRVYAPDAPDPRYRFRMRTDTDAIYAHVIYDACAGRVLGQANLAWMDWIVDFHHNLLAGRGGRQVVGVAGVGLLISAVGGVLLVLLSRVGLRRALRVRFGGNVRTTMFESHRSVGLVTCALLFVQAVTGAWLCFPQPLRAGLALVIPVQADERPARPRDSQRDARPAGLGDLMRAATSAIPDGTPREIRMPEGYGNVQIRMWRPGDFRSLGNNVVTLDRVSAAPLAVDRYDAKQAGNRIVQAMAGLHYAEWGGLTYRTVYGASGAAVLPLLATGAAYWWLRTRRRAPVAQATRPPAVFVDGVQPSGSSLSRSSGTRL